MRYLITGGAGFIGSHVADAFIARGDEVVILDNFNDYYFVENKKRNIQHLVGNSKVAIVECDVSDEEGLRSMFESYPIDCIIHLAARAGVRSSIENPLLYEKVNVRGTYLIFELAREFGITDIVYASSSSVYGDREHVPFSEKDNVDEPISPYAATKKACEEIAFTYHHLYNLNTIGLRFFTVYGERGRPDMAPWKFTERVLTGKKIQQYGDGTSRRDYTYIEDIVDGVVRSVDKVKDITCEVINLGRGEPVVLKDFIEMIRSISGIEPIIEYLPDQPGDVKITHADISKAKELLGYNPTTSLKEGLSRFIAWYKQTYNI